MLKQKKISSITGKTDEGNNIGRFYSSGLVRLNGLISKGQQIAVVCRIVDNGVDNNGHWPAVWLMREGDDELYLEVNLMEKFGGSN